MIVLDGVSKWYPTWQGRHYVLREVSVSFPPAVHLALLGRNGAGKSTLLRLIGGIDFPNLGTISAAGSISWPIGLTGGFQGSLTGRENTRFVCQINGVVDPEEMREKLAFIIDFADLGDYFDMPVKTYSSGMRARLGFAVSMAFEFDYYLIDEITAVGDQDFRRKCATELRERHGRSSFIIASHNVHLIKEHCDIGVIVADGTVAVYPDIDEAIHAYQQQ